MHILRKSKLGVWWIVPILAALMFGQLSLSAGLVSILPFLLIEL